MPMSLLMLNGIINRRLARAAGFALYLYLSETEERRVNVKLAI